MPFVVILQVPDGAIALISIDARDCPRCKAVGSFGISWINDQSANRRCGACKYSLQEQLPALHKTIICLDQNALSQMMMLVNPEFPTARRNRINPMWREAFTELFAGVRDQVLCCPLDEIHERESTVFAYGAATLSVAKMLNAELEFRGFDELIGDELFYSAKHWRSGTPTEGPEFGRIQAFSQSPNRWLNWFRIEVTGMWRPEDPTKVRAARERLHSRLEPVYDRWRAESLPFNMVFNEELHSFGSSILKGFQIGMKAAQANPEIAVFGTSCIRYMRLIRAALEQTGVSMEEAPRLAVEYLFSEGPTDVPSAITSALLDAKQANLLRFGMKAPHPSARYDIERLSSVLPHCDAILMERHFAAMLRELGERLPAGHRRCRVFSVAELDAFLEFLQSVRRAAPAEQLATARRLYGTGTPPFAA
ncbi:MAG: hypothetical protein L0219_16745 [Phycisphaerales bacterium]|nr:hypothetical protein [Phycisphaerales bacterium]